MKYNDNGEWKDIIVKATDTLPIGTEVDYNGTDVPDGWEEVEDADIAKIKDTAYPIGAIVYTTTNENPSTKFGGQWEKVRTYTGGELIAWGVQESTSNSVVFTKNTNYAWSDPAINTNKSAVIENYIDGILTAQGGAIYVSPKGIVGMVEAECTLSGLGYEGITGIWWNGNQNPLPTGVTIYPRGNGHLLGSPIGYSYGGNTTIYKYKVDNGITDEFYVNPTFKPYNGNFAPCNGGVTSSLQVKAYARYGLTYMWKRMS